jgi:hypothetical protein
VSHWEQSLMPLPVGQAIAFFYYDLASGRHKILSSYYRVTYIKNKEIEYAADGLIRNFQAAGKYRLSTYDPPGNYLPQIVRYLGYDMEPRDLQWELGPNVIAATDFDSKIIAYDVSLDKDDDSENLIVTSGSHEIGHIILKHDRLIAKAKKTVSLSLPQETKGAEIPHMGSYLVCRRMTGARPRLEFMCDEFMGCFLMPATMVMEFIEDHRQWCFDETNLGWQKMAQIMSRNFHVNPLTAAVRLTRLGHISDISEAGCRIRSIEEWKEIYSRAG